MVLVRNLFSHFRFEWGSSICWNLWFNYTWGGSIIWAWTYFKYISVLFKSLLSWSELTSITSLNFKNQLIFKCISRFVSTRSWYIFRMSIFFKSMNIRIKWSFLFMITNRSFLYSNIVLSWTHNILFYNWKIVKSFRCRAKMKTSSRFSYFDSSSIKIYIWSWSWSSLLKVFIFIIRRIHMSRLWSFLWHHLTLGSHFYSICIIHFVLIVYCFSRFTRSQGVTCKSSTRFVCIKRNSIPYFICSRANIRVTWKVW